MLSVYQQRKAIKNLKKKGILETKEFGMPLKTWYFIKEEKSYEIVAESVETLVIYKKFQGW